MKLSSLIAEYEISLNTLVSYLRQEGVELTEPVKGKTKIPDRLKPNLDKKFGVNYKSKKSDSRYIVWRKELPLINKEAVELILNHPSWNRTKVVISLLRSVVERMRDFCLKHCDLKVDAQTLITQLLLVINEELNSIQRQNKKIAQRRELLNTIKKCYNRFLDDMEDDKVLFEQEIPWDDVHFKEGKLWIKDETGRRILLPYSDSKEVFNLFRDAFNVRIPPLKIRVHNKSIEIIKTPELCDIFEFLKIENEIRLGNFFRHKDLFDFLTRTNINIHQAFLPKDRTPYFQFLVEKQCENYPFIPMYETGEKAEDSFMFTVQGETSLYIIWESIKPNTATYVFPIDGNHYEKARQALYDYVCSDIDHKRLRVHQGVINELYGIKCSIINHDSVPQWKDDVMRTLK